MDKIEFHIQPSPESHDHEVRILVNGTDIIPEMMIGMDPVELMAQDALTGTGRLTYARCSCGVVGCGSDDVEIYRSDKTVSWKHPTQKKKSFLFGGWHKDEAPFVFSRQEYDDTVRHLQTDFSWETNERTAERLIRDFDFSRFLEYGLKFDWPSGRMGDDKIAVSFTLFEGEARYQVLCYAPWNHNAPVEAVQAIQQVLERHPRDWPDVKFNFQSQVRTPPKLAGPGWREFRA